MPIKQLTELRETKLVIWSNKSEKITEFVHCNNTKTNYEVLKYKYIQYAYKSINLSLIYFN